MFGNPETQPGGRALKFFASVRMDIRRIGAIKDTTGKVIGNRTRVKVVKNKVAPPFALCEFDIMFNEGISKTGSVLDLGMEHRIIEKKGSWYAHNGTLVGQGREAAKQYFADNQEVMEEITKAIHEKAFVANGGTVAEPASEPA